ncbi:spore germination protein GerPC [Ornithinibacillus xuwenensis]|uniref:Spore germination protein GerPC n=1 Tax=Ornithinibacillus xuwenensis TaxID=3144668 RepID=A0ABU9XI65_9BACI
MNMYEWNQYLYDFQQTIYKQNQQIQELEAKINHLEALINEKNTHSVETIEYHFDQLKIERLDGTLHIGLSPSELANIDDLDIPKPKKHMQDKQFHAVEQELIPNLNSYIQNQGPEMIRTLSTKYEKPIEKDFEVAMINDIKNQIPSRIEFYEKEAKQKHQISNRNQLESYITDQVKKEIYHSIEKYMQGQHSKGESS